MADGPAQVGGLVSSSVNDRRNRLFQDGQNLHQRGFIPEALRRYGQSLILQTNGQPGKDLEVPLDPSPRRQHGFQQGRVDEGFFEPLPEDELERWG